MGITTRPPPATGPTVTEDPVPPTVDGVPLQRFADHMNRRHGHDVDRPRHLAPVVTVG
jgi:glucosamine 6-phosphate synthetase-like amidotransferase/phosphosugar isomerase protein